MRAALVLALAALVFTVAGVGSASRTAAPFKVAWILVGPHNDGGWSQAHYNGMQYVQKVLGSKVQTTYKENIAVGSQFEQTVGSLSAQGYKLIFATSYGYVTPQVAESAGIPWVGYDSDSSQFAPKSWLTASVYNWGPYYLKRVQAAMAGTWKPGFYYGSINDGFTKLAPFGPKVTAKTKKLIAARQKAIQTGKFYEFEGPLYDQSGKLKVPPGKRLKVLPDLYTMQWLVKGVQGSISRVPPP